jgi:hypothetical protein
MSIAKTATGDHGHSLTVVWRHQADRVEVMASNESEDVVVRLAPADAREMANWLLDAASAAATDEWGNPR